MQLKCSLLVQKIKPIDPQVYQAYAQALSSSKFSRRLLAPTKDMDDDTLILLKNLLDSLISVLWEVIQLDTCHLVRKKDQLQVLYEGLRFFRTIMKQRPRNFVEKIRDRVGVLVCDAAMLIFSFHQINVEIDPGLPDLLERIDVIRAEVEEKVPQTSAFNFSITNELVFFDSIVENLMELKSCTAQPIAMILPQTMLEELAFLRSFLGEIVELRNEQEELQTLWTRVLEVIYRVELLMDHLVVGDISSSFLNLSDSIMEDISGVKTDMLNISYGSRKDIEEQKVIRPSRHQPLKSTPSMTNEVVGFHDDTTSIVNRLTRGSKQFRAVVISGMAGSGKTTLALKVYNDPFVICHFHASAWCIVSQVLDQKKVLLELLNQISPGRYLELTEHDLEVKLRRSLKGKRYLIFLDDVWTIEAWNSLGGSFPNDSNQSGIILTSRQCNIVPHTMLDAEPHLLHPLSNHESFDLLQKKLFPGKEWPPTLAELGMQIAKKSKGLPLTVVIVAGLLATMEQESWEEILDALSSGIVSSTEQCTNTLELSYKQLPDYLKPCILYFGAFPEDQEISMRRLIRLWIAEGFVKKTNLKRTEDVAEKYMVELIERNLVMVSTQRSIGGAKTCRIHDLLHDFCLRKVKQESFFNRLQGLDQLLDFKEPGYLRRLCIYSEPIHFKTSEILCPRARSLLFFPTQQFGRYDFCFFDISFIMHIFKLLKVLDIERIPLGDGLPSEVELLVQLKYLAIRGNVTIIPSSIGKLCNLETLIIHLLDGMVSLPHTIWNLQKLKYICISGDIGDGGIFPIEYLENSSILCELETFSGVVFYSHASMKQQMRKFPNIRRLKCILGYDWKSIEKFDKIVIPNFLSRLESLTILGNALYDANREFSLPVNLRKLTLSRLRLCKREISIIGKLPNLEVLKLLLGSLSEDTLEMEEGEFSKLRFLKLCQLEIVKWTAFDEQLPYLQKLVLEYCGNLEKIPSCLESVPTLEVIDVISCSRNVESSVKHIEEVQMDLGNKDIRIHIQSWFK